MSTRRLMHPLFFVMLIALCLLSARLLSAQTATTRRVAVATHALARGVTLTAEDFELRDTSAARVIGAADSTSVAIGWVTRRAINAGEVLRAPAVEAPSVVNANTPVEVEFADKNVTLTLRGVAARNGAVGERVPVRTESGRRLEGTVVAPGRVRVN